MYVLRAFSKALKIFFPFFFCVCIWLDDIKLIMLEVKKLVNDDKHKKFRVLRFLPLTFEGNYKEITQMLLYFIQRLKLI